MDPDAQCADEFKAPPESDIPLCVEIRAGVELRLPSLHCQQYRIRCAHNRITRSERNPRDNAQLLPCGRYFVCANCQPSAIMGVLATDLLKFGVTLDDIRAVVADYEEPEPCVLGVLETGELLVPIDVLPHIGGDRDLGHALHLLYSQILSFHMNSMSTSNRTRMAIFSSLMTQQVAHMTKLIGSVEEQLQHSLTAAEGRMADLLEIERQRTRQLEEELVRVRATLGTLTAHMILLVDLFATSDRAAEATARARNIATKMRAGATPSMHGDDAVALQFDISTALAEEHLSDSGES